MALANGGFRSRQIRSGRIGRSDISLAGEYAEHEVESTFEERVIDVASDYETLVAECVSELDLPP